MLSGARETLGCSVALTTRFFRGWVGGVGRTLVDFSLLARRLSLGHRKALGHKMASWLS